MKSQINDYLEVIHAIYKDACIKSAVKVSNRDLNTIKSRIESQGISFLTITLPNFARDIERCVELGQVDSTRFPYFRKRGFVPAFLQGLTSQLFDIETGRINDVRSDQSSNSTWIILASIRQICLAFKKIKLPCSPKRERAALDGFIANEHEFSRFPLPKEDHDIFVKVSSMLWDSVIHRLRVCDMVPRHGPGQTAERISGNAKYAWRFWYDRIEPYFPLVGSGYPICIGELDSNSEELRRVSIVHSTQERPVRVVLVPKTLKTPRVIAIEPCCMQFAQQGIHTALVNALESSGRTAGHINFRDQSVNQNLALISSIDGLFATIDLSDASDRVPLGYALQMFRGNPDLKDAIEACRSTKAKLPDGRIVHLRKFASMGSALCFPIEAMYFYTICVIALLEFHNLPVSFQSIDKVAESVYVYGDDIIVPVAATASVLHHLRKYNCRVNEHKTFYRGRFRESCGTDAFDGKVVTPIYITRDLPQNRQQVHSILSTVSSANQFENSGYQKTALVLFKRLERILGKLPWVQEGTVALGRNTYCDYDPPKRFNRRYQRLEIKCWVQAPVYRTDILDGYAALAKSLRKLENLENLLLPRDGLHLKRSALYGAVAIKRRWVPASLIAGQFTG